MTLMTYHQPTLFDILTFDTPTPAPEPVSRRPCTSRPRRAPGRPHPHTDTPAPAPATTHPWVPDDHLITAAQAGQLHIRNLTTEDRCWVVAGLTARGTTADDIARMLRCSIRLVKQIRAHPMTAVMRYAQNIAVEVETIESRAKAGEKARDFELEQARREAARYKKQRDDLIDQLAAQRQAERG